MHLKQGMHVLKAAVLLSILQLFAHSPPNHWNIQHGSQRRVCACCLHAGDPKRDSAGCAALALQRSFRFQVPDEPPAGTMTTGAGLWTAQYLVTEPTNMRSMADLLVFMTPSASGFILATYWQMARPMLLLPSGSASSTTAATSLTPADATLGTKMSFMNVSASAICKPNRQSRLSVIYMSDDV